MRWRSEKVSWVKVRKRHSMQQWLEQCWMMMTTTTTAGLVIHEV